MYTVIIIKWDSFLDIRQIEKKEIRTIKHEMLQNVYV